MSNQSIMLLILIKFDDYGADIGYEMFFSNRTS